MKTLKLLFVALFATLLLVSCNKVENEKGIEYYKQPTGEGYVFVKNEDGTITAYANKKNCIQLESGWNDGDGLFATWRKHRDLYSTDENGKYTCKFVWKIDKHVVEYYEINLPEWYSGWDEQGSVIYGEISSVNGGGDWLWYYYPENNFLNKELIIIDTIFVTLRE